MKIYRSIRLILVIIPVLALGSFGYRYVNPSGELIIDYDFCVQETPYFSGLSPYGRVLETKSEKQKAKNVKSCFQQMVVDPVYFDIRLPQSYQTAAIELVYDKKYNQEFDIGVGVIPEEWKWQFNRSGNYELPRIAEQGSVQSRRITNYEKLGKSFETYQTVLNLDQAQFKHNRYRFIVSAPALDTSGQEIVFYNMKLRFEKEPLNWKNAGKRLHSVLNL